MSAQTFNIFFLAALGMAGVLLMLRAGVRTCKDVLLDLGADVDWGEESDQEARSADASLRFPMPRSKALQLGLLEREEQLRYLMLGRLYPLGGALLLALLRYVFAPEETKGLLIFAGMGAALGYLVGQRREKTRRARYLDEDRKSVV